MRALYYTGTMQSEMRDAPEPVAGEGQVVIDISLLNCSHSRQFLVTLYTGCPMQRLQVQRAQKVFRKGP